MKGNSNGSLDLRGQDLVHMRYLINFLNYKKVLTPKTVQDGANLSKHNYDYFMRNSFMGTQTDYVVLIFNWLKLFIEKEEVTDRFPHLSGVLHELFQTDPSDMDSSGTTTDKSSAKTRELEFYAEIARAFFSSADFSRTARRNVSDVYHGAYRVYRYAAQTTSNGAADVVKAYIEVEKISEDNFFPRFTLHFPVRKAHRKPRKSEGFVIPIKNHVFFVGRDINSGYPTVIVFPRSESETSDDMDGLVLRQHYSGNIMSSRCNFRKVTAPDTAAELDAVAILPDDNPDFLEELNSELSDIINEVSHDGKGVLFLKL